MNYLKEAATIDTSDLPLLGTVVMGYGAYRYIMQNNVLHRLAQITKVKNEKKFINRAFDLIHYTLSAILGIVAVLSRPYGKCVYWAYDCRELLMPSEVSFTCSRLEKNYAMFFLSYYIVDVLYLKTQTDFITVGIHHIATLSLIFGSIYIRATSLCLTIMILHDICDVPLYLGKIASYLGYTKISDPSLVSFAGLTLWFRMINYLMIAIYARKNLPDVTYQHGIYNILTYFLGLLYFCHCVWFYDILKAAKGLFLEKDKSAIRDNRSD